MMMMIAMLVPSLMPSLLFVGNLQKIIRRPSATSTVCHRIFKSTPLFASPARSRSFGQLVSSDLELLSRMNESSCPCCSFLGKNLFLPWGDTEVVEYERVNVTGGSLPSEAVDVLSPSESWQAIISARADAAEQQQQPIALVDTHGHPHLERSIQYAKEGSDEEASSYNDQANVVVSITAAVSPIDWDNAIDYACRSQHILPALGVHPWYLGDILMKNIVENNEEEITSEPTNIEKYLNWEWLSELEAKISQHPNLIIGEIGLCKMARFVREFPKTLGGKATALQLQKIVFKKQMELAAQWRRPVTVHCVNAHGIFMETLDEILKEARESCSKEGEIHISCNNSLENEGVRATLKKAFPPAIAMHSFTGTAHHVQQILDFERSILYPELVEARGKKQRGKKKQQKHQDAEEKGDKGDTEILFYFGFSHSVNYIMCTSEKAKRKGIEAVQAIPSDRLLVESDVHATEDVILGTAGAAAYAAHARGESLQDVAETSTRNGLRFISSLSSRPVDHRDAEI